MFWSCNCVLWETAACVQAFAFMLKALSHESNSRKIF